MSLLSSIPFIRSKAPKQVISESWKHRERILDEDVNLFCWKRSPESAINDFLHEMVCRNVPPATAAVAQSDLKEQLSEVAATWDSSQESGPFWEDVYQITYDFLHFSKDGSGTLHLRIIDNNACTKFHTDGYPLRLFTTYIGQGTEWLPEDAVNRSALGKQNEQIVKNTDKVQQMAAGHVGILKGELPTRKRSVKGIVHRSPEIVNTGEKRIILRVDI